MGWALGKRHWAKGEWQKANGKRRMAKGEGLKVKGQRTVDRRRMRMTAGFTDNWKLTTGNWTPWIKIADFELSIDD